MNMDMTAGSNLPTWLTPLAWVVLTLAAASAAAIAYDIYWRGHRHPHTATELVWISSGLYLGPVALIAYLRHGRRTSGHSTTSTAMDGAGTDGVATLPSRGASAGLPGGSASAVAHLIGVPLVIASGLTIAGIDLWVMIIAIAILAMGLLFLYERVATAGGGRLSVATALGVAALTVLAFDIGMAGWMLLLHFTANMPPATDATFWLLMQIGIILGVITGYPVVSRLNHRHRTTPVSA